MITKPTQKKLRQKRVSRVRAKIVGTNKCPRMCITRSHYAISVELIDDEAKKVLKSARISGKNTDAAQKLGKNIVEKLAELKIKNVVFDRSGYRYHGVIKTLADTVREGGITI